MTLDCEPEQPRRRAGRPPMTVTLTVSELAGALGITPGAVSKRIERGQPLETPRRYGLVKDVTEEPKRKPIGPAVDPVKQREADVLELLRRLREHGSSLDAETALQAAWDMGHGCGSRP